MEGTGLKLTPVIVRLFLVYLSMFDLWLELLRLIASPNSPNRGFNPPLAAHPPPPPTPPPFHPPTLCNVQSMILKWF